MRIEDLGSSANVEDRRGVRFRRGGAIGGGAAIVALVLALMGAPQEVVQQVLRGGGESAQQETEQVPIDPAQATLARRANNLAVSTEQTWSSIFAKSGEQYTPPKVVLFSDAVESACGQASSAVGPFYCPLDRKVYLDLSFFDELDRRFGAPGDFAQGYVVAHEVGHHIQTVTGVSERVHAGAAGPRRRRGTPCRSGRNCRPTATRACGPSADWPPGAGWTRATSRKDCAPPAPSGTTRSRSGLAAGWYPRASPTARPPSACSGSRAAMRRAT